MNGARVRLMGCKFGLGRHFHPAAGGLLLALCVLLGPAQVEALERLNLLVAGQTAGRDSLPSQDPTAGAIRAHLIEHLSGAGFAVFDVAMAGLPSAPEDDARALLTLARAATRPPLDVAALVTVTAESRRYSYSKTLTAHFAVRLVDLHTGRHLGSFEAPAEAARRLPLSCGRACLKSHLSELGRAQVDGLAPQMIARLSALDGGHAAASHEQDTPRALVAGYALVFEGFDDGEVAEMEEYLVVFGGYQLHRPVTTAAERHEFWYETTSPRVRLNRNLVKMLAHLRLPGQVSFNDDAFHLAREAESSRAETTWDSW